MNITHYLSSDLTITLDQDEEAYVAIRGFLSLCLLSLTILDASGKAIIQSTLDSTEFFATASTHSDLSWENIRVSGVEYPEVTFDIPSTVFNSPNIIYIKNTSVAGQKVKVSLRGNR